MRKFLTGQERLSALTSARATRLPRLSAKSTRLVASLSEASNAQCAIVALRLIACGLPSSKRPLDAEVARQIARDALTKLGEDWE